MIFTVVVAAFIVVLIDANVVGVDDNVDDAAIGDPADIRARFWWVIRTATATATATAATTAATTSRLHPKCLIRNVLVFFCRGSVFEEIGLKPGSGKIYTIQIFRSASPRLNRNSFRYLPPTNPDP